MNFKTIQRFAMAVTTLTAMQLSVGIAHAQTETVLHAFSGGPGGAQPEGNLIFDPQRNLYGVAFGGGDVGIRLCSGPLFSGCGVVFELAPTSNGAWKETVLHAFTWLDGAFPQAGLLRDASGNLYGTTGDGGYLCACGVVFELSPTSTGGWNYTVLHSFSEGPNGFIPQSPVVMDAAGNLYGTTSIGGSTTTSCSTAGCGVVYKLSPSPGGEWTEKVLYTFDATDGAYPYSGVILDTAGNLYGETYTGLGTGSRGTVFRLSPTSNGPWTLTTLHGFNGNDVTNPGGGLVFDRVGNLYGTTPGLADQGYCPPSCGSVFELSPNSDGTWTETILHAFSGGTDGAAPTGALFLDEGGNFHGTASGGGPYNAGTIFQLSPSTSGGWNFSVTYSFTGGLHSGAGPQAGLISDVSGNLYGIAGGGTGKYGVVFEITP